MKNQARIFTWCGAHVVGRSGCLQPCHGRTRVGVGRDSGHPLPLAFPRTCVSCEQDFADFSHIRVWGLLLCLNVGPFLLLLLLGH